MIENLKPDFRIWKKKNAAFLLLYSIVTPHINLNICMSTSKTFHLSFLCNPTINSRKYYRFVYLSSHNVPSVGTTLIYCTTLPLSYPHFTHLAPILQDIPKSDPPFSVLKLHPKYPSTILSCHVQFFSFLMVTRI